MWLDLAPGLTRQRLLMEGITAKIVTPAKIASYLLELSAFIGMQARGEPSTYAAEDVSEQGWTAVNMGYAGWLYWVSSGVHFHSYPTDPPLFTVDAYTCKAFSVRRAIEFTRENLEAQKLVWKEVGFGRR